MDDVGVIVIRTKDQDGAQTMVEVMVVDGIPTMDRPAAIGYFMLSVLRKYHQKYRVFPELQIKIGTIREHVLTQRINNGQDVYVTKLHDGEFGELYRLIAAVESGNRDTLQS